MSGVISIFVFIKKKREKAKPSKKKKKEEKKKKEKKAKLSKRKKNIIRVALYSLLMLKLHKPGKRVQLKMMSC